jgi:hypothetical protein
MKEVFREVSQARASDGCVIAVTREDLARLPQWRGAFANQRKDWRYYEIVEDTLHQGFDHRYFILTDTAGAPCAIQPYFILDQDILAGSGERMRRLAEAIRKVFPRFMVMRTLMLGCAAGEGHLDAADEAARSRNARVLADAVPKQARKERASLVVLKEFPAEYRASLESFLEQGFTRIPSMPMVRLDLGFADFDDYLKRGIGASMRAHFRKNTRIWEAAAPIEMSVVNDASPYIDEIYPLYLQMFERSKLRFERLTKDYFARIGRDMPDKARFFIWRQDGKAVAFNLCLVQDDTICCEYAGLDYTVALDLHLYYYVFRDVVSWAIANGYKRFLGGSLSYDPKRRLRFLLHPLDLYVRHTSPVANAVLRHVLPLLAPTRSDGVLPRFANYAELWGGPEKTNSVVSGGVAAAMES